MGKNRKKQKTPSQGDARPPPMVGLTINDETKGNGKQSKPNSTQAADSRETNKKPAQKTAERKVTVVSTTTGAASSNEKSQNNETSRKNKKTKLVEQHKECTNEEVSTQGQGELSWESSTPGTEASNSKTAIDSAAAPEDLAGEPSAESWYDIDTSDTHTNNDSNMETVEDTSFENKTRENTSQDVQNRPSYNATHQAEKQPADSHPYRNNDSSFALGKSKSDQHPSPSGGSKQDQDRNKSDSPYYKNSKGLGRHNSQGHQRKDDRSDHDRSRGRDSDNKDRSSNFQVGKREDGNRRNRSGDRSSLSDNKGRSSDSSKPKASDDCTKRNRSGDRRGREWDANTNRNNWHSSGDKEYDEFWKFYKTSSKGSCTKVKEIEQDLFQMPEEYALAHCVAEDMNMGSGIAVQFSQQFKRRDELYEQKQKQGGLAILTAGKDRFIYYLVTKKLSNGKPTMHTMWSSLKKLQQHIEQHQVKKLAIPRIGCGLDRLEWSEVKAMMEYIFHKTDVEIVVCNFQQPEEAKSQTASAPKTKKSCRVVNESYPLIDIAGDTALVYLGTEDGHVSEDMESLDAKFRFVSEYKQYRRQMGEIVRSDRTNRSYCLYGFIVRKSKDDSLDFNAFQKCINAMKKFSKTDGYFYVGIQAFLDKEDELILNKVVNLLRYSLYNTDVYVCWPKDLQPYMPRDTRKDDFY